jgi:small-conductance mechanosensitive channel
MERIWHFLSQLDWGAYAATAVRVLLVYLAVKLAIGLVRRGLRRLQGRLAERDQKGGASSAEAAKRGQTIHHLLEQVAVVGLWLLGILVMLGQIGVAIGPLIAGAGIAGLAFGFGAQNLVRDVISGFFMILENQVRVGDVAIVNGKGGLVERITLRTIVLRDLEGVVHVFPNGAVTTLANMTSEWSAYVLDVGVAYREDTDRVADVMKRVAAELRLDPAVGPHILEDLEVFGVDKFADSAVVIKARLKTLPIKQWEVGREYNRRLKKAFDREGIEIPFPQRSLNFAGASAPFGAKAARPQEQPAS